MSNAPITEQSLIAAGYEKRIFFFQIGGGEDEDDREIFVKDGIAITYESTYDVWCVRAEFDLNYIDGFNVDSAIKIETIEELQEIKL